MQEMGIEPVDGNLKYYLEKKKKEEKNPSTGNKTQKKS